MHWLNLPRPCSMSEQDLPRPCGACRRPSQESLPGCAGWDWPGPCGLRGPALPELCGMHLPEFGLRVDSRHCPRVPRDHLRENKGGRTWAGPRRAACVPVAPPLPPLPRWPAGRSRARPARHGGRRNCFPGVGGGGSRGGCRVAALSRAVTARSLCGRGGRDSSEELGN